MILVILLLAKCKWVMEIEGLGISFNLLNSKLIARNEAKPKKKLHERKAIKNVVAPKKILHKFDKINWGKYISADILSSDVSQHNY